MHENKSIKGFGSYGDILIRDRKMYVIPTPFELVDGLLHQHTLILPNDIALDDNFIKIGELIRKEAKTLIIGYSFNLQTNELQTKKMENPNAGLEHAFGVWRLKTSPITEVSMRN